jgi:hypothetical protein
MDWYNKFWHWLLPETCPLEKDTPSVCEFCRGHAHNETHEWLYPLRTKEKYNLRELLEVQSALFSAFRWRTDWFAHAITALTNFRVGRTEDCKYTCPLPLASDGLFVEFSLSLGWKVPAPPLSVLQDYLIEATEGYAKYHHLKFVALLDINSNLMPDKYLNRLKHQYSQQWQQPDWNALIAQGYEKVTCDFGLSDAPHIFGTVYIKYFPDN